MPRYYFHLSAPDEDFRDSVGWEVSDLSAAHSRAVYLANRVVMYGGLANFAPDFRRWTVEIADEDQRSIMTVIFPANFEKRSTGAQLIGARALQERLVLCACVAAASSRVSASRFTAARFSAIGCADRN